MPDIKDEAVHHLDYVLPVFTARVKPFSEPWPGDNPTSSQRTEYVNAYLAWARDEGPSLQVAVQHQARARIVGALPMIKAKDWTEAETGHLLYLIDEEYWRLWLEDVEPKPIWPWKHPKPVFFPCSESSRCLIHRPFRDPPKAPDNTPSGPPSCDNGNSEKSGTHDAGSEVPSMGHAFSRALHWVASFGLGLR